MIGDFSFEEHTIGDGLRPLRMQEA